MARVMGAAPKVPALVLGSGVTGLGVLRSLGRENIPVHYAADTRDFSHHSRFAQVVETGLSEFSSAAELGAALERIDFPRMVLIPCSDSWVRSVAGLDPRIAARFPSSIAPAEKLDLLADKLGFATLMQRHGIDHPRTTPIESRDDLASIPDAHFVDAFLKPRDSQAFSAAFQKKAFRVDSRADAHAILDRVEPTGLKVLLQEYIPGPPSNHYYVDTFVDRHGKTLARFARQRLRMDSDFSNSSYLRSIPLESAREACDLMDRIIDSLRPIRGMLSAEMKLDPRSGRLKIIEVNARAWKHVEFAATSGVNICKLAYEDALGIDSAPITSYLDDETCVDLYHDMACCWRLYKKREITIGEWVRSVWGAKGPIACADDPLPAVSRFGELAQGWVKRRIVRRAGWTPDAAT